MKDKPIKQKTGTPVWTSEMEEADERGDEAGVYAALEKMRELKASAGQLEDQLFDYTQQSWGWAIKVLKWKDEDHAEFRGIGYGIKKATVLLLKMESGKVGRYKVELVRYESDPPDSWLADVIWDGYQDE